MLEKIFDSSARGLARARSLREGSIGSLLDAFASELVKSRYANITMRRHLRSAEHFAHWASRGRTGISQWNDDMVERFGCHLRRRRCTFGHNEPVNQMTAASLLLKHLRRAGMINTEPADPSDRPAVLIAFRCWMHEQRGTLDVTLNNYDIPIRTLLAHFGDPQKQMNAQRLRQFFLKYSDGKSHAVIKHGAADVRPFPDC